MNRATNLEGPFKSKPKDHPGFRSFQRANGFWYRLRVTKVRKPKPKKEKG